MTTLLWLLSGLSAAYTLLFVATCIVGVWADSQARTAQGQKS
jgi:hypothetical protein